MSNGHTLSIPQSGQQLEPPLLALLEQSFRAWATAEKSKRIRTSRLRILLIFLLIRYTGAKLSEVLSLRPSEDMHLDRNSITFDGASAGQSREVQISASLSGEIAALMAEIGEEDGSERLFAIDSAFVRRKFYERAQACGFSKNQGGPEMIRKARAVELMRNNLPLPVVQRLLGHSTPNLTAAFMPFSEEDMQKATRWYMERESGSGTSARNCFFGKISALDRGDIQTAVHLTTPGGNRVSAMITNASAERLGIRPGQLITAEVKAPWLILERCDRPGASSAENQFTGEIISLAMGELNTECVARLADGTELCAVLSTAGFAALRLSVGDPVRMLFSCYGAVLHADKAQGSAE